MKWFPGLFLLLVFISANSVHTVAVAELVVGITAVGGSGPGKLPHGRANDPPCPEFCQAI